MFITCLENIFIRLNWKEERIKIYEVYLSNLRFADNIFLFANNLETLHEMIEEFQKEGIKAGLNIHIAKTKIMVNERISVTWKIALNDKEIEKANSFVYLSQAPGININMETETYRRILQG